MSTATTQQALRALVDEWIAAGRKAAGPVEITPGKVMYQPLPSGENLLLDGFIHPGNSIKQFVFLPHEVLYRYRFEGERVEIIDEELSVAPQLIVAARPCDAAGLAVLDPLFGWDYRDEFWFRRREATTIVTLACEKHDDSCFCTSVGLGPRAEKGSDVLLIPMGEGEYEVRSLTEKGRVMFEGKVRDTLRTAGETAGPPGFELPRMDFDSPVWSRDTLSCLGCGVCAHTCPTCHCFDIADEGNWRGGARVKNWDSCQFALFTQHASGHNPRPTQAARQRQRLLHKFRIYPEKFGELLCTGCGNCARNCPVGLGVPAVLRALRTENEHSGPGDR